ncbi:MAG TPA: hypothetical protein VHZ28_16200 [Terracidiphilus sp.]|nr:hypothetical protein [Terracidiphilus sp.]
MPSDIPHDDVTQRLRYGVPPAARRRNSRWAIAAIAAACGGGLPFVVSGLADDLRNAWLQTQVDPWIKHGTTYFFGFMLCVVGIGLADQALIVSDRKRWLAVVAIVLNLLAMVSLLVTWMLTHLRM